MEGTDNNEQVFSTALLREHRRYKGHIAIESFEGEE